MSSTAFRDPTPGPAGNPLVKAARRLIAAGFLIGLPALIVCAVIGTAAHNRVYSNANATQPTAQLTYPIRVKSRTGYVEEGYGRRYEMAERLGPIFWLMTAPGFVGLVLKRRRRRRAEG